MRRYVAERQGSEGSAALGQDIRALSDELNGMVIRAVATT
jgi:hypothetical protein